MNKMPAVFSSFRLSGSLFAHFLKPRSVPSRLLASLPFASPRESETPRRACLRRQGGSAMASSSSSSSPWPCSKCTFLNPPSQKTACQLCLSPCLPSTAAVASASASTLKWSCRACTFHNASGSVFCEICGTRSTSLSSSALVIGDDDFLSDIDEIEAGMGPPVGSVFWPLRRCSDKRGLSTEPSSLSNELEAFHRPVKMARKETDPIPNDDVCSGSCSNLYKILSYNVWFREDLELDKRIKALGDLLQQHSPDLICFQEVTPNIYKLFQGSNWWKSYQCSLSPEVATGRTYFCMQMSRLPVKEFRRRPFYNSIMGRELCIADADFGTGKTLVVATSHLESPCPAPPKWDQMYSKERVAQAKESLQLLSKSRNVVFCGDMNWNEKSDGPFPLPTGWVDAWTELRPKEDGWTYDTKSNPMLTGNRTLQKRLDRFVCNLQDFKIVGIDMIGQEVIPGVSYSKEKKVRNGVKTLELPVLPSDHFGLLLTVQDL